MDRELLEGAKRVSLLASTEVRMTIPSILAEGEEFSLRISVTGADALPFEDFSNRIVFENCRGLEGLPEGFALSKGEWFAEIGGLKATGPDVVLIRARVEGTGNVSGDPVVTANPAWVFKDPPYRLYWGDIHIHTLFSNCGPWRAKDPEWAYVYGRDVSHLDFAGIADHLRGIALDAGRWPRTQELARLYNEPGRFVPVLGFESSHAQGYGGDNNAYFLSDDAPYFWVEGRDDMRRIAPKVHLKELWEFLDGQESPYFTVPHHTGRAGKYRTFEEPYHDPEREPLFEIFSSWGSSEKRWNAFPMSGGNNDEPAYFVDALKAGCRYGLIASSDDHATLPGGLNNHRGTPLGLASLAGNSHKGLAAVRAPELTREALFKAMRERRTYATTLVRTLLDLRIGDAGMGEEITVPAGDPLRARRTISFRATPDKTSGVTATLVRNGVEIAHKPLGRSETGIHEIEFEDAEALEDVAIRDARFHPEPFVVYYVRLMGRNADCQWTSPVWLDI